jgi:hypothetical protein
MIPINSIEIPYDYVDVCAGWYGGQGCMLYAVCSTGGLTTGTNCPALDYDDLDDRDRKWYLSIWRRLSVDAGRAVEAARAGHNFEYGDDPGDGEGHDEDYPLLVEFEEWVDARVADLEDSYGLADWEG